MVSTYYGRYTNVSSVVVDKSLKPYIQIQAELEVFDGIIIRKIHSHAMENRKNAICGYRKHYPISK